MGRLVDIEDVGLLIGGLDSLPWEEEIDDLLKTIPTAYDVEKVVAELEEKANQKWLVLAERRCNMSETKLKPCPFCGGEAEILKNGAGCFQVYCDNCEVRQYAYAHKSKEKAIEAWNTRKPMKDIMEGIAIGNTEALRKFGIELAEEYKPKTNADRIRSMSDEELAEFLRQTVWENGNNLFDCYDYICNHPCTECKGYLKWLQAEAE